MMKTSIVTGAPGQDASYLCEFLLDKGYRVVAIARRSSRETRNMHNCKSNKRYIEEFMDITDVSGVRSLIKKYKPSEFYNLAALTHVGTSFKEPLSTMMVNGYAVAGILEAIRYEHPICKFLQAGTSEQFGSNFSETSYIDNTGSVKIKKSQNEETSFSANSPYAASKIYAFNMTSLYRRSYDLFCCNSICFNHESPRRPKDFVTRKLSLAAVNIKYGTQRDIKMGNLDPKRDVGHSKDYIRAMWMMLQHHKADDYVISTNDSVSVREMGEFIFKKAGLNFSDYYVPDKRYMRPCEVEFLNGDSSKIRSVLGWEPTYNWRDVLSEMYQHDEIVMKEDLLFS